MVHEHDQPHKAIIKMGKGVRVGDEVQVSTYKIKSKSTGQLSHYYHVRLASEEKPPRVYDNQDIPAYLFIGGTILSLIVLILLVWQLPDLIQRMRIWLHSLPRYSTSIVNSKYLADTGPVMLVTSGQSRRDLDDIHACCDRLVHTMGGTEESFEKDLKHGDHALRHDELILARRSAPTLERLQAAFREKVPSLVLLPVQHQINDGGKKVKVVLGEPLPATASAVVIEQALSVQH